MGLFATLGSSILLFCLVFGMSATVQLKQLRKQIRNRKALGIGLVLQFVILPFCGFLVVACLRLPATMGVTLMVLTSSPGGSYSNWWCSLFNAELALSITMTTLSTLLACCMLPLNLVLYTRWTYSDAVVQSLDWAALFLELVVVMGGIGCGLFASARARQMGDEARFHRRANLCGNVAGVALITLSVSLNATGAASQASLWDQSVVFYIGVALPAVMGLGIATYLATKADLEKPERVAVAVEACYQNTGIATSVAISMFSGNGQDLATAIGVPLYYGIVEAVMLAIYCTTCWKKGWTKAPPNENFLAMLWNSYEVEEMETQRRGDAIEVVLSDGDAKHAPPDFVFKQGEDGSAFVGNIKASVNTKTFASERSGRLTTSGSIGSGLADSSVTNYEEINRFGSGRRPRSRQRATATDSSSTITVTSTLDGDDTASRGSQDEEQEESRFKKATHRIKRRIQGYREPPSEPHSRQPEVPSVFHEQESAPGDDHSLSAHDPSDIESKAID